MCSVLSLNLFRSAGKAVLGQGHFGWFNSDVTFEVGLLPGGGCCGGLLPAGCWGREKG